MIRNNITPSLNKNPELFCLTPVFLVLLFIGRVLPVTVMMILMMVVVVKIKTLCRVKTLCENRKRADR